MSVPAVKGYMPLCVTLRSQVCDEQGVGQWPMWKRYDSVKGIVDQYIDEPYRDFFALPYLEIDRQKPEEYFFWYTPRTDEAYIPLNQTGNNYGYYKRQLTETLSHYRFKIEWLKKKGLSEEANFLKLSLKYAGDLESSVFCGNGRVVATVWGMRPRPGQKFEISMVTDNLSIDTIYTVRFDLGSKGTTRSPAMLKKSQGTRIKADQVPQVTPIEGYKFKGWDIEPIGVEVNDNLIFTAQYTQKDIPTPPPVPPIIDPVLHNVRFLSPNGSIIKELKVEHGRKILPGLIPQLPLVNGIVSPSWDGDPLNDIINSDRDYKAVTPDMPVVHTVRFLTPDKQVITQIQVPHGSQLTSDQVPPLPIFEGETCTGWDSDPLKAIIDSDKDFVAQTQEKVVISNRRGCLSALLKWMLLVLGLLLIFLLLWCFLFGRCPINMCGCNCDKTVIPSDPLPVPVDTIFADCNDLDGTGHSEPMVYYYDLHNPGDFLFEYATGGIYPDDIRIYEGSKIAEKNLIFQFNDITGGNGWQDRQNKYVHSDSSKIIISIIPSTNTGTWWQIKANCPQK